MFSSTAESPAASTLEQLHCEPALLFTSHFFPSPCSHPSCELEPSREPNYMCGTLGCTGDVESVAPVARLKHFASTLQSVITAGDQGHGINQVNDTRTQHCYNADDTQLANAYTHRHPMDIISPQPGSLALAYQTVLCYEERTSLGTVNPATETAPISLDSVALVTGGYGPDTQLQTVFHASDNGDALLNLALSLYSHKVMQTPEGANFIETPPHNTTNQTTYPCLLMKLCQWRAGKDNTEACGAQIDCKTVPTHFAGTHGIGKLKKDVEINCLWEGCLKNVKRKNFIRHIREHHLAHPRGQKHSSRK